MPPSPLSNEFAPQQRSPYIQTGMQVSAIFNTDLSNEITTHNHNSLICLKKCDPKVEESRHFEMSRHV